MFSKRVRSKTVKREVDGLEGVVEMTKVGILGLGKMGAAFALGLLSRGNELHVFNRSKEKVRELVSKGAIAHPTPHELAKSVDQGGDTY